MLLIFQLTHPDVKKYDIIAVLPTTFVAYQVSWRNKREIILFLNRVYFKNYSTLAPIIWWTWFHSRSEYRIINRVVNCISKWLNGLRITKYRTVKRWNHPRKDKKRFPWLNIFIFTENRKLVIYLAGSLFSVWYYSCSVFVECHNFERCFASSGIEKSVWRRQFVSLFY